MAECPTKTYIDPELERGCLDLHIELGPIMLPPIGLWMPEELRERWKEPLFRAWFESVEVQDTPQYYKFPSDYVMCASAFGQRLAYPPAHTDQACKSGAEAPERFEKFIVEGLRMWGTVRFGHFGVDIGIQQPSRPHQSPFIFKQPPPIGWWVFFRESQQCKWHPYLCFDLARIFLASGCRRVLGWKVARSMWLCSAEVCKDWDQLLLPPGRAYVAHKQWLRSTRTNQEETQCTYSAGLIRCGLARIYVYTGPGVDPRTGAERHYIALDYGWHPLRRLSNFMLHRALKKRLAHLGCIEVPVRLFRKPWEEQQVHNNLGDTTSASQQT